MINKKLGYYICDNLEFDSKIHACLYSVKHNKPVEWVFNDQEFSSYKWTKEPSESLDQLYNRRARQLREKYDYLILSYSGGSDSHQILMSFVRQNLLIDEIVVNTMEKGWAPYTVLDYNNTSNLNSGADHYLQVIPRLKEIEKFIPNTKITICDLSDHVIDFFLKEKDASWVLKKREALNPIGITRFNYLYFSEVKKRFDKQKKIGLILGVEKPKSLIHNGRFWMRFIDRSVNMVTIIDHLRDYDNTVIEYFYWSPDAVPLLIKQGHVIKRWLEENPSFQKYWDSRTTDYKTARYYHEKLLRTVVYPNTWNSLWYQADKGTKDWYCELDNWFIEGMSGTQANVIWREGVNYLENSLRPFLREDQDPDNPDGLQLFVKKYYIGDIKTPY